MAANLKACTGIVVKMLVPETDVNAAVVVCRFMWLKENKLTAA